MKRSREENEAFLPEGWNPLLETYTDPDILYHLGLTSAADLPQRFGDVRMVCMHGTMERAGQFASKVAELFGKEPAEPLDKLDRCKMYKVGPVISMSHGMGMPSILIFLHEVAKMLVYAGCDLRTIDFIRLGTSGGVGIPAGSVVLTKSGWTSKLEPGYEHVALGKVRLLASASDSTLVESLADLAPACDGADDCHPAYTLFREAIPVVLGDTMTTDDFYEGQGRLDGVFGSWFNEDDKMDYLRRARGLGIRNIEMEGACFLAFFRRLGAGRAAVVCTTLLDRLEGDQVKASPSNMTFWVDRAQNLVIRYIRKACADMVAL